MNLIGGQTDWLVTLLNSEFFGSCIDHKYFRKNEKNVFCIDCGVGICRHCAEVHNLHRRLQICKYVYQDVLRLQDIQQYFDCSEIQTYKINGEKAIHLNTRPQAKDARPSTKSKTGASCKTCKRYIQDFPNRFCSIACKISITPIKRKCYTSQKICRGKEIYNISEKEFSNPEGCSEEKKSCSSTLTDISDEYENLLNYSSFRSLKRLRKRKGVPQRSPCF